MTLAVVTSKAVITLDGVQIGGIDEDDVQIEYSEITGWHDAAPRRSGFTDRDNADGQFDAPAYKSGRVITVTGWAMAPSRAVLAPRLHRMTGILAGNGAGTLTVDDPDYGTLSAVVRITDGPQINWNESQHRFMWQFQATAPDPLKYGPPRSFGPVGLPTSGGGLGWPLFAPNGYLDFGTPGTSGRITISNDGNTSTWPVYVITGPVLGGFTLTDVDTGRVIRYIGDVPAGAVLTIRAATGRADLNGTDRSILLPVAQWTPVPKYGTCTVQLFSPGPAGQTGTLTVLCQDAFE